MQGNPGANLLAREMTSLAKTVVPRVDWLDLGTILADGSLRLDRLTVAFPAGTFYVLEYLTLPDPMITTIAGGSPSHTHDVPRPAIFDPLTANDRVLVALVNDGKDPIVIGRVRRVDG